MPQCLAAGLFTLAGAYQVRPAAVTYGLYCTTVLCCADGGLGPGEAQELQERIQGLSPQEGNHPFRSIVVQAAVNKYFTDRLNSLY